MRKEKVRKALPTSHKRHPVALADDLDPERDVEQFRVDEKARRPIREIRAAVNSLAVTKAVAGYVYCWARYISANAMTQVDMLTGMTVTVDGVPTPCWEIVEGKMPEAMERRSVDGTRKIGDVMLLRCKQEVYDAIRDWEAQKVANQQLSVEGPLREFASRHNLRVYDGDELKNPRLQQAFKQSVASGQASRVFAQQLRTGTVQGHEIRQ